MLTDKSSYYYLKTTAICLTILTGIMVTAFLAYTKALLIPLVISVFLYTILGQITLFLKQKFSFPTWVAVTISVILAIALFLGIILFTSSSVGHFLKGAEVYRQNLLQSVQSLAEFLQKYGITLDQNLLDNYLKDLPIFNWLRNFGGKIFSVLSNITLIILFMVFFLIGSKKTPPITNPSIKEMLTKVSAYLSVKLIASLGTGCLVLVVLLSFNVKLAVLFSLFAFLLNFIPSVGSILAVLLPVPVLFLQFGFGTKLVAVISLISAIEFVVGNFLEPHFLGEEMDLHPATIVGSLIFWTLVWGVPGAFLSVPITASIKIVLSKIKHTHVVAELLAGRLPH